MGNLSSVLKKRRKDLGLTLAQIADKMSVAEATVQRWESGNIKSLRYDRISKLAEILNVSPSSLMGWDDTPERKIPPGFEPLPDMAVLPLVGNIACGTPILAEQNIEDRVGIPAEWHADFVLRCRGDSMAPVIRDGDLVAIRQQPEVENGQIAAVRIENEATLKRVYLNASQLRLVPVNPEYEPIFLLGEEMNTAHIEGLAVGLCRGL